MPLHGIYPIRQLMILLTGPMADSSLTHTARKHPVGAHQTLQVSSGVRRPRQEQRRQEGRVQGERFRCDLNVFFSFCPSLTRSEQSASCSSVNPASRVAPTSSPPPARTRLRQRSRCRSSGPSEQKLLWVSGSSWFECGSLVLTWYVLYFLRPLVLVLLVVVVACC